ncbi:hypothetical protein [Paenacidovorax monticola]|uniref:Uncharacterized protein n=1 Tax=Paenacidovorax monticola TaxID=1926868 RepID=A0A7H0HG64_9BURK|nr:hypothetical protein [Paenacidovorax monticola]QNP59530.1 hypothetical protein H9L24_00375 [Paenacidovorax monticola]
MKQLLSASAMALALLGASAAATAQTTTYPEGAELLTQEALREALAGKVFSTAPARGPQWQWQFKPDGRFFLSVGSYSDSGKWSTKESSLCLDSAKNVGCNEMRQKDNVLYLKRNSGEVVSFQQK